MTLKEKLKDLWDRDASRRVRISSGSGWFFFGDKYRFDECWEKSISNFHDTQVKQKEIAFKRLKEYLDNPVMLEAEYPTDRIPNIYDTEGIKKYTDAIQKYFIELEAYMSVLDKRIAGLYRYNRIFNHASEYTKDFVPFMDRRVLESYKALDGDEVCIKIEGDEQGAYWLESEFIYEVVEGNRIERSEN